MRMTNAQYLEKEVITVSARNNNASAAILDGQPVFYQGLDKATNFGVDVTLRSDTNSSAAPSLAAGIAKWSKLTGTSVTGAAVGDVFESICYGFTDAIVTLITRAASTDAWASYPAIAVGDQLIAETVGNNLGWKAAVVNSNPKYNFYAAETQVSQTTIASSTVGVGGTSASALINTIRMKVFVNAM